MRGGRFPSSMAGSYDRISFVRDSVDLSVMPSTFIGEMPAIVPELSSFSRKCSGNHRIRLSATLLLIGSGVLQLAAMN